MKVNVPEKRKYSNDSRTTQRFANLAQISNITVEVFVTVVVSVSVQDRVDDVRYGFHRQKVRVGCLIVVALQDFQIMLQCMEIKMSSKLFLKSQSTSNVGVYLFFAHFTE